VSVRAKLLGQPVRHRDMPEPAVLGRGDESLPIVPLHSELPFRQIHIGHCKARISPARNLERE
jgi:hypothetical protein